MRIVRSGFSKQAAYDEWEYKGHHCVIEKDVELDNIKYFQFVTKPGDIDANAIFAPLSPYDRSRELVELWIDAGYPTKQGIGPWRREDLKVK